MKSLREQFEEDYKAISVAGRNGKSKIKYIYDGLWYVWEIPEGRQLRQKGQIAAASIVSALIPCICGCIHNGINTDPVTVISASCALALYVIEFFGLMRFLYCGKQAERMTYRSITRALGWVPFIRGALLLAAAAGGMVYSSRNGMQLLALCVLAGYVAGSAGAFFTGKAFRNIAVHCSQNA